VSIAELKKINGLTSDQLSINQKLWIPKNEVTAKVAAVDANPVVAETQAEVKAVVAQPMDTVAKSAGVSIKDSMALQGGMPEQVPAKIKSSSLKEYEKKVTAQIGYEGMKADRSWVMINKHKKGEVIAVINPANKKMVYCTVIGELPEKKGGKQIAISQSVADRLGITEANATLRVRYVAQ
jgi:LysM repeat protein